MQNVHPAPRKGTPPRLSSACTSRTVTATAQQRLRRRLVAAEAAVTLVEGSNPRVTLYTTAPMHAVLEPGVVGGETTLTLELSAELLPLLAAALSEAVERAHLAAPVRGGVA